MVLGSEGVLVKLWPCLVVRWIEIEGRFARPKQFIKIQAGACSIPERNARESNIGSIDLVTKQFGLVPAAYGCHRSTRAGTQPRERHLMQREFLEANRRRIVLPEVLDIHDGAESILEGAKRGRVHHLRKSSDRPLKAIL